LFVVQKLYGYLGFDGKFRMRKGHENGIEPTSEEIRHLAIEHRICFSRGRRILMKRLRKPLQTLGITLAGLICCLVIPLVAGPPAWAASPVGQTIPVQSATPAPTGSQVGLDLSRYVTEGYTVVGRINLASVNAQKLSFPGDEKNKGMEIILTGKQVSVMDEAGHPIAFSSLRPGTEVYVCYKASSVVIYVASAGRIGGSRHAR
jgi:hypothetical protein